MKRDRLTAVVFIIILAGLCLGFVFAPRRAYSENENRYLASMPALTAQSLLSGDFTSGFESFVTDAFPLRDSWIAVKSRLDLLAGRRDTGGVYVTGDGCLIEMFTQLDQERYSRSLGYLRRARELYSGLDSFRVMLVPTAAEVWHDRIGPYTPDISQASLLNQAGDILSADCLAALSAHRDEYIYYRTDHHWTGLGAYYCYQALMGDEALPIESFERRTLSEEFLGTTFSKCGIYFDKDTIDAYIYPGSISVEHNMSENITDSIYDMSFLDKKDKYSVFLGGNQALTVIKTGSGGGRLLLIKDSYANTFVQFLLPHYGEIHIVDLRSFGMSLKAYAQQAGITDILVLYNLKGFAQETTVFRICE